MKHIKILAMKLLSTSRLGISLLESLRLIKRHVLSLKK